MHRTYEVHTWTCSIPDCKEQITGGTEDYASDQGWENQLFYAVEFDLCPDHNKELKEFLFNDKAG